jgi:hypothetical protein
MSWEVRLLFVIHEFIGGGGGGLSLSDLCYLANKIKGN